MELSMIAGVASRAPAQCRKASELFRLVPASENIDHLRSQAGLHYSCSSSEQLRSSLDRLADVETEALYGSQGAALRPLVWEFENARLFLWAGKPADHLRCLKNATRELCRDDLFSLAIRTLEQESEREDPPVGGTLGLWTVQPSESFDEETRSCLARAAAEIQTNIDRFPGNVQWQMKGWLDWYRESLENSSISKLD